LIAILLGGLRLPISKVKKSVRAICEAVFVESESEDHDQSGFLSKLQHAVLGPMPPGLATEKETRLSVEKLKIAIKDTLHISDDVLQMDEIHGSKYDQCLA
jgi:hypothetical protein